MVAGMGEIIKCAGVSGLEATKRVEAFVSRGIPYDLRSLKPLIRQSAELKARLVSRDEREMGPRMFLNFGHTFAHAIESSLGYGRLLHGEAVILGLHAALQLGASCGYSTAGLKAYQAVVRQAVRLLPRRKLHSDRIIEAMGLDKKRSGRGLRFVLLERLGKPIIYDNVGPRSVRASVESMIEVYAALGGKDAPNSGGQRP
jgi:3-dehydroquinate synthase